MRIAFVSDIHGNIEAWRAVRADLVALAIDKIISLGDMVGYGPAPAEVLAEVYQYVHAGVLGNHDAVIAGRYDPKDFNEQARALIDWTAGQLDQKAVRMLSRLPLEWVEEGAWSIRACHASPVDRERFPYLVSEADARAAWAVCSEPILVVGHTHRPRLLILTPEGQAGSLPVGGQEIILKPGHRYILNAGSVGMARERDDRAVYLILDTEASTALWRAVPFDLEAFARRTRRAFADPALVEFVLGHYAGQELNALRPKIDFAAAKARRPRKRASKPMRPAREEGGARRPNRIRTLTLLLLPILLLGALALAAFVVAPAPAPASTVTATKSGWVNINTADEAELATLPGIGPTLATRILRHRAIHGKFATTADLTKVKGVGKVMLKKLEGRIGVE